MIRQVAATVLASLLIAGPFAFSVKAHPAWGIAVDGQGQVFFSDLKNIWKLDDQGRLSILRPGDDHTHELNVDEAGNIYGAENSYDPATKKFFSAIWKITPSGPASYLLAPTETPPNGTSIWRDRQGNTYHFTDHPRGNLLVLKRSPAGQLTVVAGGVKAARTYHQAVPYSAGSTAFGADGSLYFTYGSSVRKLTPQGGLTALARDLAVESGPATRRQPTALFGIAADAKDNIFVADHGNKRILKIDPAGTLSTLIRMDGPWYPTGVAAKDHDLYFLEEGHTAKGPIGTRVRRMNRDGSVSILATVGPDGAPAASALRRVIPSVSAELQPAERDHLVLPLLGISLGLLATAVVWRSLLDRR